MTITLASFGPSLATREKARAVVASLRDVPGTEVHIDMDGVSASPSFIAELLTQLSVRFMTLTVSGGSDHLRAVTFSLVEKLGLQGRIQQLAPR